MLKSTRIRLHKSETIREQKRRTLQLESHKTFDVHFTRTEHFHSQLLEKRSHSSKMYLKATKLYVLYVEHN